ncbi:MAG: class I SAM-dependent methyltransferase [Deltaproteobacteria bacterium]|nr:class I SAM-dependent methyltransferase [Deltaproteobacteria bacterium]MCX7953188.1 class I SAM-dependent methyltransferase [Deltaproteobacteria bacterium]
MTDSQPDEYVSTQNYSKRFSDAVGQYYLKKQREIILEYLGELRVKSILEIGAGHAQICNDLHRAGYDVTCVVSAKECAEKISKELKIIVHPILEFMPSKSFDCIIALKTLGHVDNFEEFLKSFVGYSRVIIIDYPSNFSFARFNNVGYSVKRLIEKKLRQFSPLSPRIVRSTMLNLGYSLYSSKGLFFLPIAFYRFFRKESVIEKIEKCLNFDFFKSPRIECYLRTL